MPAVPDLRFRTRIRAFLKSTLLNPVRLLGIAVVAGVVIFWGGSFRKANKERASSAKQIEQIDLTEVVRPSPPDDLFVGSAVCAQCHSEIANRYQQSGMGRALSKIADETVVQEDYDQNPSFKGGLCEYRIERIANRVWHHEILSDDEGVIYDQREEISYAMGSNTRGRSYLIWREGMLFLSPIAWYSKSGWDLSPGFPPDHHLRFSRRVNEACINCHSGRAVTENQENERFLSPVFREVTMGCERCHGPGKSHVDYRSSNPPLGDDPMVDLSRLPAVQRDAVCYQCHFMGEERILRYGRSEGDFRPGMKLGDIWTVFLKGNKTTTDSASAVSQAMQMQSSRCYQESNQKLGCVSCHDPHETPDRKTARDFYDRRCLNCHTDQSCQLTNDKRQAVPANGSCTYCHMPPLRATDIPHTSQTDHRIPRRSGALKAESKKSEFTIYTEAGLDLPSIHRVRAEGLLKSRLGEKKRDRASSEESVKLLQTALTAMPDDPAIAYALSESLFFLGRNSEADVIWKQLIERYPRHELVLSRLANQAHDAGDYALADRLYSKLVEVNPVHARTRGRWAHTLGQLDRLDKAIEQGEQAMQLDPTMLPLYGWLAEAYSIRGDSEQSEKTKHLAERLSRKLATLKSR